MSTPTAAPAATPPRARRGPAPAGAAAARQALAEHVEQAGGELFGIGQLCEQFAVTPRTLRFYEDKGLLSPRRVGTTRVYTRRDRARLALILRSKAIGASLSEIRHYLDLYGAHGEGRVQQLRFVLQRTDQALAELEVKRRHLEALVAELALINAEVRRQLADR